MDREADAVVGGGNISGDQIGSNSGGIGTTPRQASSIPVRKKRYKKLGIASSSGNRISWKSLLSYEYNQNWFAQ